MQPSAAAAGAFAGVFAAFAPRILHLEHTCSCPDIDRERVGPDCLQGYQEALPGVYHILFSTMSLSAQKPVQVGLRAPPEQIPCSPLLPLWESLQEHAQLSWKDNFILSIHALVLRSTAE